MNKADGSPLERAKQEYFELADKLNKAELATFTLELDDNAMHLLKEQIKGMIIYIEALKRRIGVMEHEKRETYFPNELTNHIKKSSQKRRLDQPMKLFGYNRWYRWYR